MKRLSSIFVFLTMSITAFCTISFAQINIGIRGGLNISNINEDLSGTETYNFEDATLIETLNQSSRTTFNFGGFIEYWFNQKFALQINALYNQKGFAIDGNVNGTIIDQGTAIDITIDVEETIELSYLSFPLLAKASFGESNFRPYILAGPELGFLLSATDHAKVTSEAESQGVRVGPYTEEVDEDIIEFLDSFEFAIDFGGGLSYKFGNISVFADFIYSLGLTTISTERFLEDEELKNRVIMVNLGLMYTVR